MIRIRAPQAYVPISGTRCQLFGAAKCATDRYRLADFLQGITNHSALFAVAALSSAPKDAGGDTGATEEVVTIICNPQLETTDASPRHELLQNAY